MHEALAFARIAYAEQEVPIGAVVVRRAGWSAEAETAGNGWPTPPTTPRSRPSGRRAEGSGNWRLEGATLYATVEPCPMCAGAAVNARIARIVYGCPDPKAGYCGTLGNIPQDPAAQPPLRRRGRPAGRGVGGACSSSFSGRSGRSSRLIAPRCLGGESRAAVTAADVDRLRILCARLRSGRGRRSRPARSWGCRLRRTVFAFSSMNTIRTPVAEALARTGLTRRTGPFPSALPRVDGHSIWRSPHCGHLSGQAVGWSFFDGQPPRGNVSGESEGGLNAGITSLAGGPT